MRPGLFFENFFQDLQTIAGMGKIFKPVPGDISFPMIATADIAVAIADALVKGQWSKGETRGLHGPVHLTYHEAAAIIAEGIDRAVTFVTVSDDEARSGMAQAGLPDFMIDTIAELNHGLATGTMAPAEARTASTTTDTTLLSFAQQALAPALAALS